MKIGIICAMKEELQEVLIYLQNIKEFKIFNLTFYQGKINNLECILVESGVGKVNAARACQILIDNMVVDYIINVGVGASLHPNLNIGDIVIGDKLVQHDFDITSFGHPKGYITGVGQYIDADTYLIDLFIKSNVNERIVTGTIASGDIFCTSPVMAQKIKDKFNALCLEMEGASIAQVCFLSGIPFVVIRSISDTPNNNNEIDFDKFLNSSAKVVSKLLSSVLYKLSNLYKKENE